MSKKVIPNNLLGPSSERTSENKEIEIEAWEQKVKNAGKGGQRASMAFPSTALNTSNSPTSSNNNNINNNNNNKNPSPLIPIRRPSLGKEVIDPKSKVFLRRLSIEDRDKLNHFNSGQGSIKPLGPDTRKILKYDGTERLNEYSPTTLRKLIVKLLENKWWFRAMLLNTIIALFSFDVEMVAISKDFDFYTAVVISISLVIFIIEMALNLYAYKEYSTSFYLLLDLVGTISLVPDILELIANVEASNSNHNSDVARAGRAGRLARSAASLRFTRFTKVFRAIRLIRIVRVFRLFQMQLSEHHEVHSTPTPSSKLGIHISDTISKRVILLVILLIVIIPYLQASRITDNVLEWAVLLQTLEGITDTTELLNLIISFISVSASTLTPVIYIEVNNTFTPVNYEIYNSYRDSEKLQTDSASNLSTVLVVIKDSIQTEACFHIYLVLFVILVFGIGSFIITRDVHQLVVTPIDRMSSMVRKLAGTVAVLSNDEMGDTNLNEAEVIERVVNRLASIFDVHHEGDTASQGKKKSKAERMLTGSKTTEIVTKGSVYRIQVVESASISKPQMSATELLKNVDTSTRVSTEAVISSHPELGTMESILRHPKASLYLKSYLAQYLQLENFAFWNECEKFKSQTLTNSKRIIAQYIADGAISQVNIDARMRARIEFAILKEDVSNVMFAEAQTEIYKVLNQNNHIRFLSSSNCQEYINSKHESNEMAPDVDVNIATLVER